MRLHCGLWGTCAAKVARESASALRRMRVSVSEVCLFFLWKALPACSGKRLKLDMCLGCRCPGRCCFSRQRVSSLFGETRQASFFVGNYPPNHKPPPAQLLHFALACERSVSARAKHIALGDRFLARGTLHALPHCDEAANFGQPSANHWTTPKIGTPL